MTAGRMPTGLVEMPLKCKCATLCCVHQFAMLELGFSAVASARMCVRAVRFSSEQLPIKTAVAKHFAVFNNLHGAVPSMSTPNRESDVGAI